MASSQDAGSVSRMHKQNFAMQPRDWPTTSEETWRFDENLHATGRQSTAPNGQNEPLHLGSLSVNADDLPIREADVSSNYLEMASGRRILVLASSQMSLAHFRAQVSGGGGTECGTSDNGDTVSSVPVLPIPQ